MIKKMAWNTFKKTGNIDTFLELLEVENIEKNISEENLQNSSKLVTKVSRRRNST